MNYKVSILLFLLIFVSGTIVAQKKTTNVKGYYRKDGTYVRPHTRTYNTGNDYKYSTNNNSTIPNTVKIVENDSLNNYEGLSSDSTYSTDNEESRAMNYQYQLTKSISNNGVTVYLSVLRYKGKVIDICPIPRQSFGEGDLDFDKIYHKFDKALISMEDALELVSNYNWSINGKIIKKDFSYSNQEKLPKYLIKTIESINLK